MKTDELNKLIKEKLGKRGIFDYTIDSMKIEDGNYSVANNGELKCEKHMSVNVTPLTILKNTQINIIITIAKENK